jgi:hypothetical protein
MTTHIQPDRMLKRLIQAGRLRTAVEPPPSDSPWQKNLMQAIRQAAPLAPVAFPIPPSMGILVWKWAIPLAACAAALLLFVHTKGLPGDIMISRLEADTTFESLLTDSF